MNKVLFIEDDIATQKIYREKFSKDFEVIFALTGVLGASMAVKEKPDVIILDIILAGGLSGFEALKEIKKHSESKNIPVIVLTNLESQEKIAKEGGAVECLVKANTSIGEVDKFIRKHLP